MNAGAILYPVVALGLWTFIVLNVMGIARVRATMQGKIRMSEFAFGETERVPEWIRRSNRNLMNLLEVPVLFYLAWILAFVVSAVTTAFVVLAWLYVALRVMHTVVHRTSNNVFHRAALFEASNLAVLVMWIIVTIAVLRARGA